MSTKRATSEDKLTPTQILDSLEAYIGARQSWAKKHLEMDGYLVAIETLCFELLSVIKKLKSEEWREATVEQVNRTREDD